MLSMAVSKSRRAAIIVLVTLILSTLSVRVRSQSLSSSTNLSVTAKAPRNYVYEGFGPYPIVGAAFTAGINQLTDSPPEWNQGLKGFTRRFGSNLGIAVVGTSTRFGLAAAFREDTLYYRCQCGGAFPRFRHAVISTLIGRRGSDGHRVFSSRSARSFRSSCGMSIRNSITPWALLMSGLLATGLIRTDRSVPNYQNRMIRSSVIMGAWRVIRPGSGAVRRRRYRTTS